MIENRDFAIRTLQEAEDCFKKLNGLLLEAQRELPGQEFRALRKGIGSVLGYLYTDVQDPIWKKHPDLEPLEMRKDHP